MKVLEIDLKKKVAERGWKMMNDEERWCKVEESGWKWLMWMDLDEWGWTLITVYESKFKGEWMWMKLYKHDESQ